MQKLNVFDIKTYCFNAETYSFSWYEERNKKSEIWYLNIKIYCFNVETYCSDVETWYTLRRPDAKIQYS